MKKYAERRVSFWRYYIVAIVLACRNGFEQSKSASMKTITKYKFDCQDEDGEVPGMGHLDLPRLLSCQMIHVYLTQTRSHLIEKYIRKLCCSCSSTKLENVCYYPLDFDSYATPEEVADFFGLALVDGELARELIEQVEENLAELAKGDM